MAEILSDLGEAAIIENLILPRFPNITDNLSSLDDCALLDFPVDAGNKRFVQTSDPCPPPVIFELFDRDYYHYGWLTATINASDLASTGALPFSLSVNIDAPPDMLVSDFNRFLDGLKDASDEYRLPVVGGNIRDQSRFAANGFAIGFLDHDNPLHRVNAKTGDVIVSVGNGGHFWSSVLLAEEQGWERASEAHHQVRAAMCRPTAKIEIAHELAKSGLSCCAIDASDGLQAGLRSLAKASGKSITIDLHPDMIDDWVEEVSSALGIDPYSLLFAWGDWQLIFTTAPSELEQALELIKARGCAAHVVGTVGSNSTYSDLVSFSRNGQQVAGPDLESSRFNSSSYMTHGLKWWIDHIKSATFT